MGPLSGPFWGPKRAPKRSLKHTKNHIEICTLKRCPNWPPEALQRPPSWPPNRPQIGLRPLPSPLSGHHQTPIPPSGALRTPSRTPPGTPSGSPPGPLSEPLWTLLGGAHGSLPGDPSGDRVSWVWAGGIREAIRILSLFFPSPKWADGVYLPSPRETRRLLRTHGAWPAACP